MGALTGEMLRSLLELQLGFKGELTMSAPMEALMNSLYMEKIPPYSALTSTLLEARESVFHTFLLTETVFHAALHVEEHSHYFINFLASEHCPGHFWTPPLIKLNRVTGLGIRGTRLGTLGTIGSARYVRRRRRSRHGSRCAFQWRL